MLHLLEPFAESTTLLNGEMYSTLNSVVPDIMDISIHLQNFIADENSPGELVEVATYMQDDLTKDLPGRRYSMARLASIRRELFSVLALFENFGNNTEDYGKDGGRPK